MNYAELDPKEFYEEHKVNRKDYETRAEKFATITLPYLMRKDGSTRGTQMDDETSQSYCGRLVNTLKSKMAMALLPASMSSFRFVPNQEAFEKIIGSENKQAMTDIHKSLSQKTLLINTEIERQAIRESLFMLIANMMVVGSIIVEKKEKKGIVLHPLKTIAVDLDNQGEALAMCFVEKLKRLPEDITAEEEKDEYELFTFIYSDEEGDGWTVAQSVEGNKVGEETKYKEDTLPYQYLGWTWMPGEDMHRPYVEDYYEDMSQLNKLATVLTDGAVVAAKTLLFCDQRGGRTRTKDVANSKNGDVVDGSAEDVTAFQLGKNYDFQVPMEREQNLKRELSAAFLMNESATRDAERVTKAEVMFMAKELEESSLSGIYSMMATKWSKWIVRMIMQELKISFDAVEPEIITGLDALGRSQEAQALDNYIGRLMNMGMEEYLNKEALALKYAALEGLDVTGIINTQDEVNEQRAESRKQAVEDQALSAGADELGKVGAGNMAGQPQ